MQDHGVKALFISIAVLLSLDAAFNHGAVSKGAVQMIGRSFSASGSIFSDSIFSR